MIQTERPDHRGSLAIICLLGSLPAFTSLKLGSLQPEDFVLLLLLGFCIAKLLYSGLAFNFHSNLGRLSFSYSLLVVSLLLFAILDLRMKFYPLDNASLLKQPAVLPFVRLLQFTSMICGFLWLTKVFLRRQEFLVLAMNVYWRIGIVSSWYAILSYLAIRVFHFSAAPESIFGAYSSETSLRARGFFNEGGPFGLYLVSVLVLGLLRRYRTKRRLGVANTVVIFLAFLLSGSKAGLLAAALLALYSGISAASVRRRVYYLMLSASVLVSVAIWMDLGNHLLAYVVGFQTLEQNVDLVGDDPNVVLGRIAALYIVPKMIVAHPVTGIGIGNYPLVRNDPDYLGFLPTITDLEDQPGLGFPGIAAEFGIPATLWLVVLLLRPYWMSRKKASVVGIAALFQPLAHAFSVQLTFFYPWFVSACALATCIDGGKHETKAGNP
jgi:hypothetical protein